MRESVKMFYHVKQRGVHRISTSTHCSLHGPHGQQFPKCSNNNQVAGVRVQYILWNIVTLNWRPPPLPLTTPSCYQFNPFNSLRAYPDTSTGGHRRFAEPAGILLFVQRQLSICWNPLRYQRRIRRFRDASLPRAETRTPALITRDLREVSLCFETIVFSQRADG